MIDPAVARERVVTFLTQTLAETGAEGYVLGVSGGLDSALAGHLAVEAVGAEKLTGLVMPGAPSAAANMADARALCDRLDIAWREISIEPLVEAATVVDDPNRETIGNVRARARMMLWYELANEHDLLVLGADNRSEWLLGYFTKHGDGAVDIAAFGDLYKTELYALARHVDIDETFLDKQPTAELWEGQTDAAELGATYETIDPVLRGLVDAGKSVDAVAADTDTPIKTVRRLAELWRGSQHKRELPPVAEMPRGE